ncbi:putative dual-specificity RNA methyltransferase RlmN [Fundidesulfovibrio magnetotacticus]|uniref:Probable dual-specificity RNA methyltransferase RlmN n=1 Tax=Fundidesulfovibrio magnetotacticus TaxID=2730080 RepID=A0A6V8LXM9_9BACT|nr:23S rRNA (adenine(2503)-C(2))-methyltransferase RlmN [Fundidesulfovibrio magnetotacticus]GFK95341.1 putative dual-specificity RNA methyltransferase RlmN [Fundidesulfovibrio magnetotacticus]
MNQNTREPGRNEPAPGLPSPPDRPNLLDLSFHQLESFLVELGEKPFRARQVWQWLWQKRLASPLEMTNLSKDLRARLADAADIRLPAVAQRLESRDGTVKFLLEFDPATRVETVLIPEKDRYTQCLSTQAGCAMACTFCRTGTMGLARNLSPGEILAQILVARNHLQDAGRTLHLRNLVFMGMGEPLLNYDNLLQALEALHHPQGLDFSTRRVTVSTVGVEPGILEFGRSGLGALAVSLHAPNQELRAQLMPKAARMLPLDRLMDTLAQYPLKPREHITFEYVLLGGVNDSPALARDLVRLLSHVKGKVNLIAYNESPGIPFTSPSPETVEAFQKILWDKSITVTLRKSKGRDIAAACGQLAAPDA